MATRRRWRDAPSRREDTDEGREAMSLERRSFLRGLLVSASAAAGTALVKLAKPEDVKALVEQRETLLSQHQHHPVSRENPPDFDWVNGEVFVRDRRGDFAPIGYLTSYEISTAVDAMLDWHGTIRVVPGLQTGTARFSRFGN